MIIDLHNHTRPASPCSQMSATQLLQEAARSGLDGICVTDHNTISGGMAAQAAAANGASSPLLVLRGVEARTTIGDVLVFGIDEDFPHGMDGPVLLRYVHECGGASVLAHPFHRGGGWALWYWLQQNRLPLDADLSARPEFEHVHAIETFNAAVTTAELELAEDLARILGLPTTGGSDAHTLRHVARTATEFARPIRNEADLVAEIRAARIRPRRLR